MAATAATRLCVTLLLLLAASTTKAADIFRVSNAQGVLSIRLLHDDLVQLEWRSSSLPHQPQLAVSPMVARSDFRGISVPGSGNSLTTRNLRLDIDRQRLCVSASDLRQQPPQRLTTLCPQQLTHDNSQLTFSREGTSHIYGLGQQHPQPGQSDGDWQGRLRHPGNSFGNAMLGQGGGAVGNTQIPVAYLLGSGKQGYALFADSPFAQRWDFRGSRYQLKVAAPQLSLYLISGGDLPQLRRHYLDLTGRPPVPPKKMFGLWLSEYGFDNWQELDDKLASLRANKFPVDGAFLDLQWFGGIRADSDDSRMGALRWDNKAFADAGNKVRQLRNNQGIGLGLIEEPYISRNLPEHRTLASKGYLVRPCPSPCQPLYLDSNPWWGKGGMLDFSNPAAANFWHDWRREPLINGGIMAHWTDLGEPEQFSDDGQYHGIQLGGHSYHSQAAVHNLYNLLWSRSISSGYQRNKHQQRPFILSRSGAAGSQRYGVALWSGDIGGRLDNLAAHLNAQMHMSLAGIDYFGSDVGGFHRGPSAGEDERYTLWFAASALLDVPLRPHVQNLCNCHETAPDRIGDSASNLANLRLRYRLAPYYYQLAHRAWRNGDALIAPLVYHYQQDQQGRSLGNYKMIGPHLLAAINTRADARHMRVYLPAGDWYHYHSDQPYHSRGQWVEDIPLYDGEGRYQLPLFARSGAIIPEQLVNEQTLAIDGFRGYGQRHQSLLLRLYPNGGKETFTLSEDDGESIAYQQQQTLETTIELKDQGPTTELLIQPGRGGFAGMANERELAVLLIRATPTAHITLNGQPLAPAGSAAQLSRQSQGWWQEGNRLQLKLGQWRRNEALRLAFSSQP